MNCERIVSMSNLLKEQEIKEAIVKLNNSQEYLSLRKYYSEESFLKTLRVSREEKVHSNFIAWLLNPLSNHELNFYSIEKFLQMLASVSERENNEKAYFPNEKFDDFLMGDFELTNDCTVETEVCTGKISGYKQEGRIDIFLSVQFKVSNKILPVLIENKVLSSENKIKGENQTEKYLKWAEDKFSDTSKYYHPIFVFLAPDFERDIHCECEQFIKISYQNLVDYLIEPCLLNTPNARAKILIEDYLRCLSNTSLEKEDNRKERKIMAFSTREKELLKKFHEKNKDLFDAVLTALANDEELPDADRKKIKDAIAATKKEKYLFNDQEYGVGPLVLAVVKKYNEDYKPKDFSELENAFPKKLLKGKNVVQLLSATSEEDRGEKGGRKRYFSNADQIIKVNGAVEVLVSNQWTKELIPEFIKQATKLGYTINKIS